MKEFLKRNSIFIALSLILVGVLGFALVYFPKGELHLLLCDHHTPARDAFFTYYTRVAEYLPYIICVLVLLFGRLGNAAMASACIACSELTTQLLKHIINAPRPITWFAANLPDIQLPLVEGVHMNQWLSFPSGHTTSFFSLFFVLSILATKSLTGTESAGLTTQWSVFCQRSGLYSVSAAVQLLLFIAATTGAYSRIYLSQHFAADVLGGITVGLLISIVVYAVLSRFEDQKWYNYRLLSKKMT